MLGELSLLKAEESVGLKEAANRCGDISVALSFRAIARCRVVR